MLKKLRIKFMVIIMCIVTAMLLVIFGTVYHFTARDLENQGVAMAKTAAHAQLQHGAPGRETIRLPYFTLRINSLGLVTAQGNTYYDLTDESFLRELLNTVYARGQAEGLIQSLNLRYCVVSGMGEQCVAFVDISGQRAALRTLLHVGLLIGCVSFVALLGISWLLARWAVRPVEKAWEQQKQFVSDASHELKTPLTVIMSSAELLQSPDCDDDARNRFAGSILTMSCQMRKLVEGLLELARADNGQVRKQFAELELSTLVGDALLPYEPILFEQGLMLESCLEPDIRIRGNAQYLMQVVDILLDNARKYSDAGQVTVQLKRQGRGCLLTVDNPGIPIPPAEQEKIFQRFYRGDQARTRTGSFGLGLSIAKSIVQEHGGRIWVESNATGNRFCVQLPGL